MIAWFSRGHHGPFSLLSFTRFALLAALLDWRYRTRRNGNPRVHQLIPGSLVKDGHQFIAIQYLRGVAAVAIVFKHAAHPGGALQVLLDAGVDLFFVISGFVMVASTHGRPVTPGMFIWKRCRRVLPMWWLTLCLVALLGLGSSGIVAWLLSVPLIPHRILSGVGAVYWGVGWTLAFEAVFYAYFAIGLAARRPQIALAAIVAMVAMATVVGRPANPVLNEVMHPLLLEFVMGSLIAYYILTGRKPPLALAPLGVMLLAIGATFGHNNDLRPLTLGLPCALVVTGLAATKLPEAKSLKLAGDASYSIYLLHYVPILLAWQFVPENSWWPLTAAAGIGLGILAYRYAEKPLLDLTPPKPPKLFAIRRAAL